MSFLAEQLEHFGEDVEGGHRAASDLSASSEISEMVALALHFLNRIEAMAARSQPAPPDWDESAARQFLPLFAQWEHHAGRVLAKVRECIRGGIRVEAAEEFIHRYNVTKLLSSELEQTASIYRSRKSQRGIKLDEVADELQRRSRPSGN